MGRKNNGKGFGGAAPDHFGIHPLTLDAAVLQLSRLGAVKLTRSVNPDDLPDGTVVWEHFPTYNTANIQAIGEGWLIDLTICDCCPGIKAWEVKVITSHEERSRAGQFLCFPGDSWQGAAFAIEVARELAQRCAEESSR